MSEGCRGRAIGAVLLTVALSATGCAAVAHAQLTSRAAEAHGACDFLDAKNCLFPFPNDSFTRADASTDTGRRVDFRPEAMPKNRDGTPIDPTEWNRSDGFSPGSAILTFVPGLDLVRTRAAPVTDIGRSRRVDAPIVLLDTNTGRRVPYWAELDQRVASDDQRALIVRPAVNFPEGHHIVVALRRLENASGRAIEPGAAFRTYRNRTKTDDPAVEARRPHLERLFASLERAGVARRDLFVAWDFTVASERNLSERLLHIRDESFAALGAKAPPFHVTRVENNVEDRSDRVARRVTGTFTVPTYLTGDGSPGSRFDLGADGLPRRNGDLTAPFECIIPKAALRPDGTVRPARPAVYGHGLLASEQEVEADNVRAMANEHDFVFCATKWLGLSDEDVPNVAKSLAELSRFPTIADRLQQGILDTLMLGRLTIASDGFARDAAFQSATGKPVFSRRHLFYDGNSLGGIMGGATTAVAQDWTRAVLGVPGMNFSTLLQRSADFVAFDAIVGPAYPEPIDGTLAISLIQMLWDRGETDGYAQHITHHPYRHTPVHTVLIHEAFGDHQVANVATEVEARTLGVRAHRPALPAGRSPDRTPWWGIPAIGTYPYAGSAIVMWDSGSPAAPPGNTQPAAGVDPHEDPRADAAARAQKSAFLEPHGRVIDVCKGRPCTAGHAKYVS